MACRCLAQTSKNQIARSMAPAFLQRFTGGNQTPLQAASGGRCGDVVIVCICLVMLFFVFVVFVPWFRNISEELVFWVLIDVYWYVYVIYWYLYNDIYCFLLVIFNRGWLLGIDGRFGISCTTMNGKHSTNQVKIHWCFPEYETNSNSNSKMPRVLKGPKKILPLNM